MHRDETGTDYRLYFNNKRFEIEEYKNGWISTRDDPDAIVSSCGFDENAIYEFSNVLNSIPRTYQRFTKYYPDRHIALLSLLYSNKHYAELLSTSPAVASILCYGYGTSKVQLKSVSNLVDSPRHEIVQKVFGHCTKSDARLLSKFQANSFSDLIIDMLWHLLQDDKASAWLKNSTVPYFDEPFLSVLLEKPDIAQYPFFRNQIMEYFQPGLNENLWRRNLLTLKCSYIAAENYAELLSINNAQSCFMHCKNIEQLEEKWRNRVKKAKLEETISEFSRIFPPPPINGTPDIVPIRTIDDLIAEGIEMDNCIGSKDFAQRIIKNKYYIYRILRPERATLGINMEHENVHYIDQLMLKGNELPSDATWRAVKEWFEEKLKKF